MAETFRNWSAEDSWLGKVAEVLADHETATQMAEPLIPYEMKAKMVRHKPSSVGAA